MKIRNAKRWAPTGIRPYIAALLAFGLAFLVRYLLQPLIGPVLPLMFFTSAGLVVEFYFGLLPALFVLLLGIPVGFYFFIPPFRTFDGLGSSDLILICGYMVLNALGILLIELLRREQYQTRLLLEIAESRHALFVRAESERKQAELIARQHSEKLSVLSETVPRVWYVGRGNGALEYTSEQFLDYGTVEPVSAATTAAIGKGPQWLRSVHPDDVTRVAATLRAVCAGEHEVELDFRLCRRDGGHDALHWCMAPMQTRHGVFVRLLRMDAEQATIPGLE